MHNYNSFERTVIATLRIDFMNARQCAYNNCSIQLSAYYNESIIYIDEYVI